MCKNTFQHSNSGTEILHLCHRPFWEAQMRNYARPVSAWLRNNCIHMREKKKKKKKVIRALLHFQMQVSSPNPSLAAQPASLHKLVYGNRCNCFPSCLFPSPQQPLCQSSCWHTRAAHQTRELFQTAPESLLGFCAGSQSHTRVRARVPE